MQVSSVSITAYLRELIFWCNVSYDVEIPEYDDSMAVDHFTQMLYSIEGI